MNRFLALLSIAMALVSSGCASPIAARNQTEAIRALVKYQSEMQAAWQAEEDLIQNYERILIFKGSDSATVSVSTLDRYKALAADRQFNFGKAQINYFNAMKLLNSVLDYHQRGVSADAMIELINQGSAAGDELVPLLIRKPAPAPEGSQ